MNFSKDENIEDFVYSQKEKTKGIYLENFFDRKFKELEYHSHESLKYFVLLKSNFCDISKHVLSYSFNFLMNHFEIPQDEYNLIEVNYKAVITKKLKEYASFNRMQTYGSLICYILQSYYECYWTLPLDILEKYLKKNYMHDDPGPRGPHGPAGPPSFTIDEYVKL